MSDSFTAGAAGTGGPVKPVGQAPLIPAGAARIASMPASSALHVTVALAPPDPAALEAFAQAVSTPGNPQFGDYLSVSQFASVFAPSDAEVAAVQAALRSAGLDPGPVSANHLAFSLTATSAALAGALHTSFATYRLADGRVAFANTQPPSVPAGVAPFVQAVLGLDDLSVVSTMGQPQSRGPAPSAAPPPAPAPQASTGGPQPCRPARQEGAYTADQLASAYQFSSLYRAKDFGTGQTIALYEVEPNWPKDIAAYQKCYHTSAKVSYVPVDGGAGTGPGENPEAALDIEDVIGLAPKANIIVYQAPCTPVPPGTPGTCTGTDAGFIDTYGRIVSDDDAAVVVTTAGDCEAAVAADYQAEDTLFQEAALQGQTVVAASGDYGSEDCYAYNKKQGETMTQLAVDDPASQQFVSGVGGTSLNRLGPPPTETTWNDGPDAASTGSGGSGGGGVSTLWPMRDYQAAAPASLHVVNAYSSGQPCHAVQGAYCREVPDVAADADPNPGYVIYYKGKWTDEGGTSAAAPLWGALFALTNASAACGGHTIGFANPALYAAAASRHANNFHDVTRGNNDYTGTNHGLYPAGRGYDMATGLGTPDGAHLPAALCVRAVPQIGYWLGYADNTRPKPANFPIPWNGSPNVLYSGCQQNCIFEGGAVRIVNNSHAPATVANLTVNVGEMNGSGGCVFSMWPTTTIPAGGELIAAQTASGSVNGCPGPSPVTGPSTMDTSDIGPLGEPYASNCTPDKVLPIISLTLNGAPKTLVDYGQILNTGGIDAGGCPANTNESAQWCPIDTPGAHCSPATVAFTQRKAGPFRRRRPETITAAVTDADGAPLQHVVVHYQVTSGPDRGLSGTATTNAKGFAPFTYTGGKAGIDRIAASVTTLGGTFQSGFQLSVTWR